MLLDGSEAPLRYPIPAIPQCKSCAILDGEGACSRACQQQMQACRVWYHASDGGRRRQLVEPFIRPAESTASSRDVVRELGLPVGSPRGLGIDLAAEAVGRSSADMKQGQSDPAPTFNTSSGLRPSDLSPETVQGFANVRVLHTSGSGPKRLWKELKKVVRPRSPSDPARLVQAMAGRARSQSTSALEVVVRTSSVTLQDG